MRLPFDLGILGTDPDTQKVLTKAVLNLLFLCASKGKEISLPLT